MNDPLDLPLRDIHLPDGVAFWPPAYGWWIVIALIIITVLALMLILWWNRRVRNSAITLARKEYARITAEYRKDQDPLKLAREISVLLRRLSISLFPRTEVASLTGERWLEFLDRHVPGNPFTRGQGRMLVEAPYRQNVDRDEMENFIQQCKTWIDSVSRQRKKPT